MILLSIPLVATCEAKHLSLEHEFEYMDYTHVSDYWFDWVSLEKAEAGILGRRTPHCGHKTWSVSSQLLTVFKALFV